MWIFFSRLFNRPGIGILTLVLSLFIHILGLASTVYVIQVYSRYLGHGIDSTLYTLASMMFIVLILEATLRRLRWKLATAITAKPEREMGERVFGKLARVRMADFEALPAEIKFAATRGLDTVQTAFSPANFLAVMDAPYALVFIVAVLFISLPLGIWVFCMSMVAVIASVWGGYAVQKAMKGLNKAQADAAGVISSAGRLETVRASNAAGLLVSRWNEKSLTGRWARIVANKGQERIQVMMQSFSMIMTTVVIGFGATLIIGGKLDFGALIGVNILAARSLSLIIKPAQNIAVLMQGRNVMRDLDTFLECQEEGDTGTELPEYKGRLEFSDLAFGYPGGTGPLFERVNLVIEPGEMLLVSGGNGTGKTTMARLILGLLSPGRGAILADGVDLRQMRPNWWRSQVMYLPQEPEFLDATLRDNLSTFRSDLDDEELTRLLKVVGLGSLVAASSKGLDMLLNNGGRNFSPGVRRRMALARALTTAGKLVVIDEPSEGLDPAGIAAMTAVLNDLSRQGRTIIIMTHDKKMFKGNARVLDLSSKPEPVVSRIHAEGGSTNG